MNDATFSDDRMYRYTLGRDVNALGFGRVNFILLNPSTADETQDDPTIRRCIGYARAWGYAALTITNLFAFRATDPRALRHTPDPVGPLNDQHLRAQAILADRVVVGWGTHGALLDRGAAVAEMLKANGVFTWCLTKTSQGQPGHPLYLPRDLVPMPFTLDTGVAAGSVADDGLPRPFGDRLPDREVW